MFNSTNSVVAAISATNSSNVGAKDYLKSLNNLSLSKQRIEIVEDLIREKQEEVKDSMLHNSTFSDKYKEFYLELVANKDYIDSAFHGREYKVLQDSKEEFEYKYNHLESVINDWSISCLDADWNEFETISSCGSWDYDLEPIVIETNGSKITIEQQTDVFYLLDSKETVFEVKIENQILNKDTIVKDLYLGLDFILSETKLIIDMDDCWLFFTVKYDGYALELQKIFNDRLKSQGITCCYNMGDFAILIDNDLRDSIEMSKFFL